MDRFFDVFQLACLACVFCLALVRGVSLYRRGIGVIAIDRQRTSLQMLEDALGVGGFLWWWYELVAYAWPLKLHLVPALGLIVLDVLALKMVGALAMAGGVATYGLALAALGESWRLGIDHETPGPLVSGGVFGWTRNPVYLAFDLMIAGTFLMQGRLLFLVLAVASGVYLHRVIGREEAFLLCRYGDAYRAYRARVGRYFAWRQSGPLKPRRRDTEAVSVDRSDNGSLHP